MKKSREKEIGFDEEELESVYQIVKDYDERILNNPEDYHFSDDYDEEPTDKEIIKSILDKIGKSLSLKNKELIDKEFLRKKYNFFNNSVDEKVSNIINKAYEQLRTVEIKYFNMESAEFIKRSVDVYHKSSKYIIGYCHLREDIRKFRISRINSAILTKEKYKIPLNFNKDNYQNGKT